LGKKKGKVEEWLKKIFFSGASSEFTVFIKHRVDDEELLKPIPGETIVDVRGGYIYTRSGEQIPFHRVKEIRNKKGEVVYRRD
jgi:uncharacterized protein (UPF0248 family)